MSRCHLCGTSLADAPVVGTMSRGDKPSRRVSCVECGLVQVDPQPDAAELTHYYATDYHTDHGPVTMHMATPRPDGTVEHTFVEPGDPRHDEAIATMHRGRARFVVGDLQLPHGARVLEVGCSDGRTLAELQRLGMEVDGVEPDDERVEAARERTGVETLWHGDLESFLSEADPDSEYDAVIAFHVLEHFPNPLEALGQMRSLLKPGGQVWVEVPSVEQPGLPLTSHWQWVHLYDFSAPTLVSLFHMAGLGDDTGQGIRHRVAHNGSLQCWGQELGCDSRPYEPHWGPGGEKVAAVLEALERVNQPKPEPAGQDAHHLLTTWLGGTSVVDLAASEGEEVSVLERTLRRALADVQAEHRDRADAWEQAVQLLGGESRKMAEAAYEELEGWDPDRFLYGVRMGRGEALLTAKTIMATIANSMKRRELG